MIYIFPEYKNFDFEREYLEELSELMDDILDEFDMKKYVVNLVFCDDNFIRDLNRRYRDKDAPTDVLSFSQLEGMEEDNFDDFDEEKTLGDIIISVDTLKKNAKEFETSEKEELARLSIHGLLHLLGFDHERSKEDEEEMLKLEDSYLNKLRRGL